MSDIRLFEAVNGLAGHFDSIDDFFQNVSRLVPLLLIALLVVAWFWPAPREVRTRRQLGGIAATIAACLALGVNQIIIRLWDRPRPFVSHHAILLLAPSHDPSFPSDHATFGAAVAVALALAARRIGLVAIVMAVLLAFARVYTGEHYVSDVVAGVIIGGACAVVVTLFVGRIAWLLDPPMRLARRIHLA